MTVREAKMAQFNPCDEPLAFSESFGLCRIQSRETRASPSLVDLIESKTSFAQQLQEFPFLSPQF